MKKVISILVSFVLLISLIGCTSEYSYTTSDANSSVEATQENTSLDETLEEVNLNFRNKSLLKEHFEKHGQEFPYDTMEDYLAGANKMLNNPDKLHKTEAEDGDDVYYLEATNEFIIVSLDGYIRTYFKPRRGIDYYNAQ